MKTKSILIALFAATSVTIAQAAIFQPDSIVDVSSEFSSTTYAAEQTINGSGLLGPLASLPDHDVYARSPGNHWTTAGGTSPLDAWIEWGFASPVAMGAIYLWNHQSTAGHASNTGYDVTDFELTFLDALDAVIGTFSATLAVDSASAQAFSFGSVISGVSSVRLDVNGVQSSPNYTGLAEVAFDTETLEEPIPGVPDSGATAALLGAALLALGAAKRRASVVR